MASSLDVLSGSRQCGVIGKTDRGAINSLFTLVFDKSEHSRAIFLYEKGPYVGFRNLIYDGHWLQPIPGSGNPMPKVVGDQFIAELTLPNCTNRWAFKKVGSSSCEIYIYRLGVGWQLISNGLVVPVARCHDVTVATTARAVAASAAATEDVTTPISAIVNATDSVDDVDAYPQLD